MLKKNQKNQFSSVKIVSSTVDHRMKSKSYNIHICIFCMFKTTFCTVLPGYNWFEVLCTAVVKYQNLLFSIFVFFCLLIKFLFLKTFFVSLLCLGFSLFVSFSLPFFLSSFFSFFLFFSLSLSFFFPFSPLFSLSISLPLPFFLLPDRIFFAALPNFLYLI